MSAIFFTIFQDDRKFRCDKSTKKNRARKFYLLETSKLDEKLKNQKTLTLSGLLKLNPLACTFLEIKPAVEKFEMKYQTVPDIQ